MPLQPAQARPRRSVDQTATLRPQDTGHWHVVVAVFFRCGLAAPRRLNRLALLLRHTQAAVLGPKTRRGH